ncbi:MAG: hypothetical protein AAFQ91_27995 [Cyanobacteria bacterium J06621_15]
MTFNPIDQNQIIAEINLIPEDRRRELYELIHQFRIGLDQQKHNQDEIMQFAGSWSDMPEEDFSDFCEEIEQRRQATSSRRFDDETLFT